MELLVKGALQIIDNKAGNLFAYDCGINFPITFCHEIIKIYAPNLKEARRLSVKKKHLLVNECLKWSQEKVEVYSPETYQPITIDPFLIMSEQEENLIQVGSELKLPNPKSYDDEITYEVLTNSKPASILSIRTNKVILVNRHVPNFTALLYDELVGSDIRDLFEERRGLKPDDLTLFHERLIKDKSIHGTIKSFRSSGAFAIYPGKFEYKNFYGIPVRVSTFDPVEIVC